jgi:hypothetical protein
MRWASLVTEKPRSSLPVMDSPTETYIGYMFLSSKERVIMQPKVILFTLR